MRDSKKILILLNLTVVLLLVLSSSVFTFFSLHQENFELNKYDEISLESYVRRSSFSLNKSLKRSRVVSFLGVLRSVIQNRDKSKGVNTMSYNLQGYVYDKQRYSDNTVVTKNEDGLVMVENNGLYTVSLLIQISYAFGLAGLYTNRDVLKLGVY